MDIEVTCYLEPMYCNILHSVTVSPDNTANLLQPLTEQRSALYNYKLYGNVVMFSRQHMIVFKDYKEKSHSSLGNHNQNIAASRLIKFQKTIAPHESHYNSFIAAQELNHETVMVSGLTGVSHSSLSKSCVNLLGKLYRWKNLTTLFSHCYLLLLMQCINTFKPL